MTGWMLCLFAVLATAKPQPDGGVVSKPAAVPLLAVSARTLEGLSESDRRVFLESFESSGTRARLQRGGLVQEEGPVSEDWGAVRVFQVRRPDGSAWAEVGFFSTWDAREKAWKRLQGQHPKTTGVATRLAGNGAFLVRVHAKGEKADATVSDVVENIIGRE